MSRGLDGLRGTWIVAALACAGSAGADPYFYLGGRDFEDALVTGRVNPIDPIAWQDYMAQWQAFAEGDPYPPNVFYPPDLYVWPGGGGPDYPPYPGLVMVWTSAGSNCCHCWNDNPPVSTCDQGEFDEPTCLAMGAGWDHCQFHPGATCNGTTCVNGPTNSISSAWVYNYGTGPLAQGPVDLSNAIITVTVTAPQFDLMGNQINAVSLGVKDVNGAIRSWQWGVGPFAPIRWGVSTAISIDMTKVGVTAATPVASGYASNPAFQIQQSLFIVVDENANWIGGGAPIPPPGGPPGAAWNYWYNLSVAPKGAAGQAGHHGPVSFSVNGVSTGIPGFDGPPRPGNAYFNPPWNPPPAPPGAGPYGTTRVPPTPQAVGIATARIGDVNDYSVLPLASEGEIFQSEPDRNPAAGPSGTNNQILRADALGMNHSQANVDAYSFGEDFFNGDEMPLDTVPEVIGEYWVGRGASPGFPEPTVAPGGLPITFYFSVDPFAIGSAATAVRSEATLNGLLTLPAGPVGSADPSIGPGAWQSAGEAAGDVFHASPVTAPTVNFLDHDDVTMALLGPSPMPIPQQFEDDLDALEHVGTNTLSGGMLAQPGNTHDRVVEVLAPDLADPSTTNHRPDRINPVIFSVDRATWGAPGSAVQAQVNSAVEGASGDLFIAVTVPAGPFAGMTTNMLLVDEGQLGLMPHDDLDAVILRLNITVLELAFRVEEASIFFNPEALEGSTGYGFTLPLLQAGEAAVGFSVDAGSIGLLFSAVDFECRVDGMGLVGAGFAGSGVMEQAGDIFFSRLMPPPGQMLRDQGTNILFGQNYLWFEEQMLGLDRGNWSFILPGPSGNLGDTPDELNALDSDAEEEPQCAPDPSGLACTPVICPNPQDVCVPILVEEFAVGQFRVIQCECRDPNLCHVELPGGLPACVGGCPQPQVCIQVIAGNQYACQCVVLATGACCLSDGTCQITDSVQCANLQGTYMGDGTACGPQGSCCTDGDGDGIDESCTTAFQICCEQMMGGTFTAGGDCLPSGACCFVHPAGIPAMCEVMAEDCCSAILGSSFHAGQTCDPVGACCWDSDGNGTPDFCDTLPQPCCADVGGTFHATDTCTAPQACCVPGATCQMMDPVCCEALGGTPQGFGSDCSQASAVCQACCLPDGRCVETGHSNCVARGGDPQGPSTPTCVGVTCSPLKWAQPPTFNPTSPHPECFWGWDELAIYGMGPVVADDWLCLDGRAITDLHWWGSYRTWTGTSPPPVAPMQFEIAIWTDVPIHDPGNQFPFSHPGQVIRAWTVNRSLLNERPVACDFHSDFMQTPEGCFRYDFRIPEPDWFVQENACTVYWVSIAARYQTTPGPNPWGWKTRQPRWNDDAIRITNPTTPGQGSVFQGGAPITDLLGRSWDVAFVLTSNEGPDNKWEQMPNPAWPGYHAHEQIGGPTLVLADDWRCEGGVVTDLHWWGNYELDGLGQERRGSGIRVFHLSIHADIPAQLNPPFNFSLPGAPLWMADVPVIETPTCLKNNEGATIYRYEYYFPNGQPFAQEAGQVYWMDVSALAIDPANPPMWRWQEAARGVPHRFDSAVTSSQNPPGWTPLDGDLAFRVTSTTALLLPPLPPAGYPHAGLKNRYITFVPDPLNGATPHGYRVTHVPTGFGWFITPPATSPPSPPSVVGKGLTRLCSNAAPPMHTFGLEPVIHVTGCLFAPGHSYEVRATLDGVNYTLPLTVATVAVPTNFRWWADAVGVYSTAGDPSTTPPTPPLSWTPPNTVMNGFDISAALQGASSAPTAAHVTWTDVNPEVCDWVTNGPDVLRFVNAFGVGTGREFYPFNVPNPPGPQGQGACPNPAVWP